MSLIDYESMVQNSLRGVVQNILRDAAKDGLPGAHHFYISFDTNYPGVEMPEYLREQYPEEITIVLQYEFWDLEIEDTQFFITLCFNDIHERLVVPFEAIISFVDPSVKFGLQFSPSIHDDEDEEPLELKKESLDIDFEEEPAKTKKSKKTKGKNIKKSSDTKATDSNDDENPPSNVVTLDAFRKKKKT
jgi:hypothetical protein